LPGGDWVINWGSAGLATELDSSGNRVFSLTFDQADGAYTLFSYRANEVLAGQLSRDALRAGMDLQFPRGYPRPRGTTGVRVPLVPAYNECTTPDLTHGAPLSYGSCSSPSRPSVLTIGTPDANGAQSRSMGFVKFTPKLGVASTPANEADIAIQVLITDVRRGDDLSDYAGELQLRANLRITDRLNGTAGDEAGTVQDMEVPATVPCAATAFDTSGSSCALTTTMNALQLGSVVERKRAIWGLGAVKVYDGGAAGSAGAPDAKVFETQGVFVP
jgi:hypothetical protein